MDTIRNPIEWSLDQLKHSAHYFASVGRSLAGDEGQGLAKLPAVNHIGLDDITGALRRGFDDFRASRSDVLALSVIYPIAGLVLWWLTSNYNALPLLFPITAGFALLGPLAAVGLYEMSLQRESGKQISWFDAFGVVHSPAFGSMLALGAVLLAVFLLWLAAAEGIYVAYLGPAPPTSAVAFLRAVFTTSAGWSMAVTGIAVGFLFAAFVLAISAVSFPMLLDRNCGIAAAVVTSVRTVLTNPLPMAVWGFVVAGGLLAGSIPALVGLVVAVPVLGHATWHLYRKLVAR